MYKLTLTDHSEQVTALQFSLDDRFLLSTSLDKTIIVWDTLTFEKI